VIVSSPALKSIMPISNFKTYLINFLNRIFPEITFFNQINPLYLSHDAQVVGNYRKDKLVHNRISARCFTEISQAMLEVYKKVDLIKFPCLLLEAGDDKIVSGVAINSFFKHIKAPYKQLNVYADFYHELFNEPGQKKVFEDICTWVLSLLKERGNR
jgi:alpha-beta hydrolase superfamily lysophospholipase